MVKKNTENQSIAAEALRSRVGRAKAASTARGGSASIRARLEPPMPSQTASSVRVQPSGMARCSSRSRRRHFQTVNSASGQAGQVNQAISRASGTNWPPWR